MADPEEITAYCRDGHPVRRGDKHCPSKTCGWVVCRSHKSLVVIDPSTGREMELR